MHCAVFYYKENSKFITSNQKYIDIKKKYLHPNYYGLTI